MTRRALVIMVTVLVGCASATPPPVAPPARAPTPLLAAAAPVPQEKPLVSELSADEASKLCAEIDAIAPSGEIEASGMCQNVATFDVVTNFSKAKRTKPTKAKVRASCRKSYGKCMKARRAAGERAVTSACTIHPLDQCAARADELLECVRAKAAGFAGRAARGIDECDQVSASVTTGRRGTLFLPEGCERLLSICPGM